MYNTWLCWDPLLGSHLIFPILALPIIAMEEFIITNYFICSPPSYQQIWCQANSLVSLLQWLQSTRCPTGVFVSPNLSKKIRKAESFDDGMWWWRRWWRRWWWWYVNWPSSRIDMRNNEIPKEIPETTRPTAIAILNCCWILKALSIFCSFVSTFRKAWSIFCSLSLYLPGCCELFLLPLTGPKSCPSIWPSERTYLSVPSHTGRRNSLPEGTMRCSHASYYSIP